ncbi:MAG: hypothetical protein EBQ87_01660 [Planctomycetes bacterium]|nr:hypothetical protein [Planctomycetota bacterium]
MPNYFAAGSSNACQELRINPGQLMATHVLGIAPKLKVATMFAQSKPIVQVKKFHALSLIK